MKVVSYHFLRSFQIRSGIFAASLWAWRVAAVSIWPGGSRRIALRGTKASSTAVSFARSVKERKTANLGHGNGPLLTACP